MDTTMARFDLLPDAALALIAIYLLLFAGAERASGRQSFCPSAVTQQRQSEGEEILRWETPDLAQKAVDLHIDYQSGKIGYRLAGEEHADLESLAKALAKIASRGEGRTARIIAASAVPHAQVAAVLRCCAESGVTPF
ncbi:MAG: hypothetical protein N3A66_05070, partial [Planctomycetota bacterium]|nr:hypothetical protein [Planctomycetota bacterium]